MYLLGGHRSTQFTILERGESKHCSCVQVVPSAQVSPLTSLESGFLTVYDNRRRHPYAP